ncbi:uncharacterized protein LOC119736918 isoform X2 [Patiria miniata]|nr:uncharacterized protein LOC119736918 isoform X2 [Patiria miniata]
MSRNKQEERFGRVTGHTLRRSPMSHHFREQFVITKRTHGGMEYEDINGQFQEVVSDGGLRGSRDMVYSLNKQKRWEIPSLLKESICNDKDAHEELDFKVLLVERHLDAHDVFKPACTGVYESKTSRPERLPKQTYAHAWDLRGRDRSDAATEAVRSRIHKLRCAKNRGGKKVDWRGLLDALEERIREEGQQLDEAEERTPQLHYEVGYGRPENKYPWRPEMKMNTVTSNKRSASTKQRHRATTTFYMEDVYDTEDCIQDDIYEEVLSHSEADSNLQDEAIDSGLMISEERPRQTLGDALFATTKKPKQKKRRKQSDMDRHLSKEGVDSNQGTSKAKVQHKGRVVYDPEGAKYKPRPKPQRQRGQPRTRATTGAQSQAIAQLQEDLVADKCQLPSTCLQLDQESVQPSRLEADFGRAYAEAQCRPRRFAIQVGEDDLSSDPRNKVYLLFECLDDDPTTVECTDSVEAESWQVVKTGVHVRMTVYGLSDQVLVTTKQMSASFPSDTIISTPDVIKYMQDELTKSAASWGRTGAQVVSSRSRHNSADIPTVREALGWNCRLSTADEAYSEITSRQTLEPSCDKEIQETSTSSDECGICYEILSLPAGATPSSLGSLEGTLLSPCGHRFCNDCWRQYLRSGVKQGATDITCPEYKCKTLVDPVTTMAFLSPALFHAHYRRARDTTLARSAECHRCPNALCGRVARLESDSGLSSSSSTSSSSSSSSLSSSSSSLSSSISSETLMTKMMTVRCDCGWLWCTECKEEGHWPASCQQASNYRKAMKKTLGEKKVPLITHVQVKQCPGCRTRWEKNGGCPSMICGTCNLNFCWLCLRKYNNHDYSLCGKSVVGLQAVKLDYRVHSKDYLLELAIEHHKYRRWSTLRKGRFALRKLASRSTMAHIQGERSTTKFRTSQVMTIDVVMATASAGNHQPLTWARTKEQLEMMNRRAEETFEIAAFCHECHFVLEHLAFLLGSLPRRQRKAKWWRAMADLRFIVQNLQQTLENVPNIKMADSESTMDRLCRLMHAGKVFLRRLALSMPSTLPQGRKIKE